MTTELENGDACYCRRCADASKQIEELEENRMKALNAANRIQDLELQLSRLDEDAVVTKAMKSQLSRVREVDRENKHLKKENTYYK